MRVQKKLAVVAVAVVMAMVAKAACRYPNGCVRAALTRSLSAGYARAKPQVGSRLLLTATTHLITPHRPCYASCGHRSMPSLPRLHHPVRVYKYHPPPLTLRLVPTSRPALLPVSGVHIALIAHDVQRHEHRPLAVLPSVVFGASAVPRAQVIASPRRVSHDTRGELPGQMN